MTLTALLALSVAIPTKRSDSPQPNAIAYALCDGTDVENDNTFVAEAQDSVHDLSFAAPWVLLTRYEESRRAFVRWLGGNRLARDGLDS